MTAPFDQRNGPSRLSRVVERLPLLALALAIGAFLIDPPPLASLRTQFQDQVQRWFPRVSAGTPITVVDIDEQSIRRLGQWPWPRSRLADLVDQLDAAGARVIGFDMAFTEPDRTAPRAAIEQWQPDPDIRPLIEGLPDPDMLFARAIASSHVVLGFAAQRLPHATLALPGTVVLRGGDGIVAGLPAYGGRLGSLEALERAAAGLGHFSVIDDAGGDAVIRNVPLLLRIGTETAPALTLEMLRVAQDRSPLVVEGDGSGGIGHLRVGRLTLSATATGARWLHYSLLRHSAYLPAWRVLERESALDLSGHFVLVGSSASLMHDMRVSPLGETIPGVEVHRQLLEQLLTGHVVERPFWAAPAELIVLAIGALLAIRVARQPLRVGSAVALMAFPAATVGISTVAFAERGLILDPVAPIGAWGLCAITAALARLNRTERHQRWIRSAFSRYVSPNLVRHLIEQPESLELGGVRRHCSFIFTDLEGYTSLIERTQPREAVALVNAYLDGMVEIAFRHEGTLLRIVGDAVAVMFSAPIAQPDHARRALDCAIELDGFAQAFRASPLGRGHGVGKTRIGVHSGEVTVGNFGGSAMLEYAALGNPINEAARLESANKLLGTRMCVSAVTLAECPAATVRVIGHARLRGRSEVLQIFEPATAPDPAYDAAFDLLASDPAAARRAFEDLDRERPDDPLVAFHLARLARGETGTTFALY
ncbi:MAG: adenylate/guanylate cyclase domain-containing protein [Rhodocyclaceae bacterium]|nr:adenylate/guanylate cyclase domain-containing protein [Rhodocyclaceae bacterium]